MTAPGMGLEKPGSGCHHMGPGGQWSRLRISRGPENPAVDDRTNWAGDLNAIMDGECCPRFDPALWDGKELRWEHKRFVKDRVRSLFHIPLNFGAVMTRNARLIEAAGAASGRKMVLSDENPPWGADVSIEVTADDRQGARRRYLRPRAILAPGSRRRSLQGPREAVCPTTV